MTSAPRSAFFPSIEEEEKGGWRRSGDRKEAKEGRVAFFGGLFTPKRD